MSWMKKIVEVLRKYISFLGPGIMVSVAFMDPGNYSTSAMASSFGYNHLFVILMSNIIAIFLQVLCAQLGAITGLDLAQNCQKRFGYKTNLVLYLLTEISIIATDLAEVVGTAIALEILFKIPLFIGVLLTIIDVIIVLLTYRPNGPIKLVRIFEGFVSLLVFGTVGCFAIELVSVSSKIDGKDVLSGFLPSKVIANNNGLYVSLAILGATVMPHSLYLGSGLVLPRLREFDGVPEDELNYKPSSHAIKSTMNYTISELVVSLFTVALFVNAAILIIIASTYGSEPMSEEPDLYTIYFLLRNNLSTTAGTVFALALLFSGLSAGIVCTLAGQMVSEGFLSWKMPPILRRVITRAIAIVPCLTLSLLYGREGVANALNFSQFILSLLLPIVSAPLIYFTNDREIMRVKSEKSIMLNTYGHDVDISESPRDSMESNVSSLSHRQGTNSNESLPLIEEEQEFEDMSNGIVIRVLSVLIWAFIALLNFYSLVHFSL